MKVWLGALVRAERSDDVMRGLGLLFWDADAVASSITEVAILPPRVIAGGGSVKVHLEPFGVNDVPALTLRIDLSSPELPSDFRALFVGARRVGVYAAPGWVKLGDPLRFTSAARAFVGIWEPDAPLRVRAGEPVELTFVEIANHVASQLILPDWGALSAAGETASQALLAYWSPFGVVSYWLRDVVAVPFGVLLSQFCERVRELVNSLLPPNFECTLATFWTEAGMWAPAWVDGPSTGEQLHHPPDFWRKLEDSLVLLRARAYQGDARLDFEEYLRECQSMRDFLRRCAEMTLSNWGIAMLQNGIYTVSGEPSLPTAQFVLHVGALAGAFVDYDTAYTTSADWSAEEVEFGSYQLRTTRVSAQEDYVEEVYARRGLEWGATPPFTAGIVPVEEHYYFRSGAAQFTDKVPSVFPFVRRLNSTTFAFCRRMRVKHYRSGTVQLLSGEYTAADDLGYERGYRYARTLTTADEATVQSYVRAVAHKLSSVATLLRCSFPCLGGYDFPESVVRVGSPWRRITTTTKIALNSAFAQPMRALGRQLVLGDLRAGTIVGIEQDLLAEAATVEVLQHDVSHHDFS